MVGVLVAIHLWASPTEFVRAGPCRMDLPAGTDLRLCASTASPRPYTGRNQLLIQASYQVFCESTLPRRLG